MLISNETITDILVPYIKGLLSNDPFAGTIFEGYFFLSPFHKGQSGEIVVLAYYDEKGVPVSGRTDPGQDLYIDGVPTEIKTSLSLDEDYTINHLAVGKNWDVALFLIGNPHKELKLYSMTKAAFVECLRLKLFFTRQQGGESGGNDDYMCSNHNVINLINSKYVTLVDTWSVADMEELKKFLAETWKKTEAIN